MADVWYPGRPPLRSPEIITGLTHYIGALQMCSHLCAGEYLEKAEQIGAYVMSILEEESEDCLGSDTDINALMELLPQTFKAAVLCVENEQWDEIEDITSSVDAVRWALIHKLDAITVGGDDGQRSNSDPPTDVSGRPTPWADGEEDAEQELFSQNPTPAELQAEEALPGFEEEDEGLTTARGTPPLAQESSPRLGPSSGTEERDHPHTA